MNTYTIESFFENYKELIPSVIEKGRILRLGYNEENGTFTCQAAFDKLVPFDSTVEFEMKMRAICFVRSIFLSFASFLKADFLL